MVGVLAHPRRGRSRPRPRTSRCASSKRDRTGDRLGATLPLLDEGEVVAVVGYTSTIDDALLERFDIDAVAVRVDGDDPVAALRRRRSDHAVRVVDAWDPVLEHTSRLLVSATAIGPERALVPAGTGEVLDAIGAGARRALAGRRSRAGAARRACTT